MFYIWCCTQCCKFNAMGKYRDWDKKEYIKELQKLLNSIDVSNKKKVVNNAGEQQSLFDALQ